MIIISHHVTMGEEETYEIGEQFYGKPEEPN